jgi:pimeloyl-ACP methyl ester carboxylesterase
MNPLLEGHLLLDGRTISYYSHRESSSLPWLICFSGAGSDSFDWLLVLEELSSSANLLIVDKPGFLGTEPHGEALNQEQIAADVMAVCKKLSIHRAHLIGHSLGYLSALNLAHQFKQTFETLSITSLDGVSFNPLSTEVIKQMAPKDSFFQRIINTILRLGFIRLSPAVKDYPTGYLNQANKDYLEKVMKLRRSRRHNKAVWHESAMTPIWCEQFGASNNIRRVLMDIPQHCLQAVEQNRPFDEQPEIIYFPHLRQLFMDEFHEKIEWCKQTSSASGGVYQSIDSEHFIQWHYPSEVSRFMKLILKNH